MLFFRGGIHLDSAKINQYLQQLMPEVDEEITRMEGFAQEKDIPIMEKTAISVMLHILKLHSPKKILEIGAAIGYSAICMAKSLPEATIITVERDRERYEEAVRNICTSRLENRISVLLGDAFKVVDTIKENAPYDALFIDAAKGQYQRFFELYEPLLSDNAIVITDNVLFKGLVAEENIESKRLRSLVKKIKQYNKWLIDHPRFDTTIIPVGDGVAISIKRGENK